MRIGISKFRKSMKNYKYEPTLKEPVILQRKGRTIGKLEMYDQEIHKDLPRVRFELFRDLIGKLEPNDGRQLVVEMYHRPYYLFSTIFENEGEL